jgi:hypothetical protein
VRITHISNERCERGFMLFTRDDCHLLHLNVPARHIGPQRHAGVREVPGSLRLSSA